MTEPQWQAETDVLVIGAGGCGLAAALQARQLGADVIIVEKEGRIGGNTGLSTGSIPGAGTRYQQAAGIADSPERMAADLLRQANYESDRALVELLARESAGLVEWLVEEMEIDLQIITDYKHVGHSVPRLHAPASRQGTDLVAMLDRAIRKRDIILATGNPVQRLVADANGDVLGAVVRMGQSEEAIRAQKVILANNGFGANREMLRRHIPAMADAPYYGHLGNTGEGILWGLELGAQTKLMGAFQGYGAVAYPHGTILSWTVPEIGGFLANKAGARFVNEGLGYSACARYVLMQPEGLGYMIFDSRIRDYVMSNELEFRELVANGGIKEAATVTDLAATYHLDAAELQRSLEAFNAAASSQSGDAFGRTDFGKLAPLRPPYCIGQVVGGLFHTQGGLVINEHAQPLRADGSVIGNLYAGGGVAMGISGAADGGYSSGNGLLTAMGLGRIAGRHAALAIEGRA